MRPDPIFRSLLVLPYRKGTGHLRKGTGHLSPSKGFNLWKHGDDSVSRPSGYMPSQEGGTPHGALAAPAGVAGIQRGLLERRVTVTTRGGDLSILWEGEGTPVQMTGPAATVFEGEIEL